ncbi:MAG: Ig-like domain-containing protein, partial [Oscillospiraceae bacterium]|nr:Ig-like domain-containing protein [Oscillospiraceae bacterium]
KNVKDNLAAINKYADGAKTAITKDRFTKLKNLAKKQTSTNFFNEVDVTFLGYAEGAWNGEGMKSVTVNIVVAVKVQLADCTWQYFAWVIPVTVRIRADFSTKAGFNGTYNFQTHTWSLDGTLTFGVSLNAFGGVGIGKAVGVGAYGDADLSAVFELLGTSSAHGFKTVDLTGELGLEAYFLMFDYKKSFAHKTWNLYTKTARQMVSAQAEAASSPYDLSAFTLQDTTYMQGESAWLGDGSFVSAQSADNTIHNLLTGTYRNNQPVIATAGNTTVMVYTTADASRNAYNATRVMYSVYNKDTGTWSTPEGVDNNGTADSTPYLYSDGTKIYIAYSDSARLFTATDDIFAVSANQNMVTAVFNAATGKFEHFVTVAEGNGKFLSMPKIGTVNGKITTVWQSNNANDPLGLTSETSVYANDPSGTKLIAKPSGTVVGLAVGEQGIAVAEDTDKDLDTVNDRVLRIGTAKLDEGTISNPVYENGTLYWYANGGISTYDGEVCALYPQAVPGLTDKFVVCADRILFLSAKEGVSDIYALTQTDGQWNAPVQMTHQGMVIDTISATMIDGEVLTIMSRKDVDITETQVVSNCNLSYLFLGNTYDIQTDYAEYDQDAVKPGTDLPVQIGITNGGDTTVSGVYVTIEKKDGTAVFKDSVHTNLKPGESGEITVSMPTDGLSEATDYTVLVEQLYVVDADTDNNEAEMTVGYTELSVSAEQLSFENGDQILVHVVNNSDIPSSGKVTVQCGENVLETFDVPTLEKNEQYTYSVDVSKERIGSEQAIVDLTVDPEKEQLRMYSAHSQVALDFRGEVPETEYSASWYVGSEVYVQYYKTGDSIVPPTVTAPLDYALDGWQEAIPATMGTENLVFHALLIEKTHTHSGTIRNVVQASCKAAGYSGDLICTLCEEVMQAGHTTEKLDHRYDATIVAATCGSEGYTEYVCSTCGDKYRADFTSVDASKHTYGAWTVIQEPTATAEGLRQAVCSTCGNKKQESIPKLDLEIKRVTLSDVSVQYKSTVTLSPKVEADQGTNYTVVFTSSNPKIAEVDKDGKITTHKKGTVTITCTVTNNDDPTNVVETTANVTVKYAWWQWLIRILLLGFLWY